MKIITTLAICLFVAIGNVYALEDRPDELKALIGTKIQGQRLLNGNAGDMTFGKIPGWRRISEYGEAWVLIEIKPKQEIRVDLFYGNKKYALISYVIDVISSDAVILDVMQIDAQLLPMHIANDKVVLKKQNHGFMNQMCRNKTYDVGYIVGISKPESKYFKYGCTHWTKKVKVAWLVDSKSGKISEIPTGDVTCFEQGDNECSF
jgi:hypothetical protein